MRILLALCLCLFCTAALAEEINLSGPMVQGGLVVGQSAPGAAVVLDGRPVRVAADGRFVFGFGWDYKGPASLIVTLPDGRALRRSLSVQERRYKEQRIDGLPERMVTPPDEVLARIRRENAAINAVRETDTDRPWFADGFAWPVKGIVTGVFGSRRILNGQPRRPHFGIDIAAAAGTKVTAPAPGRVAMAEPDLYFTGGTVMLDHGHGVTSVYSHLQAVTVEVGTEVKRGDVIGTVGSTGRSTGAHLDWRVNWFDQRLDPALLVGPMPK